MKHKFSQNNKAFKKTQQLFRKHNPIRESFTNQNNVSQTQWYFRAHNIFRKHKNILQKHNIHNLTP